MVHGRLNRVSFVVSTLALAVSVSFCVSAYAFASEKNIIHAGYRTLSSSLPSERFMLSMGVWYPSLRRPGTVKVGSWTFRAARNAPVMKGSWPVIILSHDITGSAWSHHEIAAALARRGFIVAAPTHDFDNAEDMRMFFSDRELPLRAVQLRAALDELLDHDKIGPHADTSCIGFLGFGIASPAGFMLAGASLSPEGWPNFVQERQRAATKGGAVPSPWLTPYAKERMDRLVSAMEQREKNFAQKESLRKKALKSRESFFQKQAEHVERSHRRHLRNAPQKEFPVPPVALPLLPPLALEKNVADARYKAFALVSPGYSMLFTRESMQKVQSPVLLVSAGFDAINLPAEQAERFSAMLPGRTMHMMLEKTGMADFHAQENPSATSLPAVRIGLTPEQRRLTHSQLLFGLEDFFRQAFSR